MSMTIMTTEEAAKLVYKIRMDIFKHLDTKELIALDMAIEALQAKTNVDLISKHDAIDAVQDFQADEAEYHYYKHYAKEALESLPSRITEYKTFCGVPIEKAVRIVQEYNADKLKTGKWIFNPKDAIELMFTLPKCSECGFESSDCGNYCSNCGAKMGG